jgi:hypothetical protein
VLYRAGRHDEAVKALRQAMGYHPDGGVFRDWVFLALAEHRLGHADAAADAAARARTSPAGALAEGELLTAELNAALPPLGK